MTPLEFSRQHNGRRRPISAGFCLVSFSSAILLGCDRPADTQQKQYPSLVHQAAIQKPETSLASQDTTAPPQSQALSDYLKGVSYDEGKGVTQDHTEAAKWYRRSAEKGYAPAETNLGAMYANGQGVPQDYNEAVKWMRKAALQGGATAQFDLGLMYARGQGVPQDNLRAHMWWNLAAMQGDSKAAEDRNKIAENMSPEQVDEAQRLARDCQQSNYQICGIDNDHRFGDASIRTENPGQVRIPMVNVGGVYEVPVRINDSLSINFIVDSGATDVNIPADVALTLVRTNTIGDDDFIGNETYTLADGSTTPSSRFRIRSLKLGDVELQNVVGSVGDVKGVPLLGQSFLSRFKAWSIDNDQHALVLSAFPTSSSPTDSSSGSVAQNGQPNSGASFDCRRAADAIEKLVCGNGDLSAQDSRLSALYSNAETSANGDQFKDEQRYWLKFVRAQCSDLNCLSQAYESRIAQITAEVHDSSFGLEVPGPAAEDVVTRFYQALGRGDGEAASALIVPAKRDAGPLSSAALGGFYSNLGSKFALDEVQSSGFNQVTAHYRYLAKSGKACVGYSVLTIANRQSVPLIAKIEAPLKC